MQIAYLGLGANLGDARAAVTEALARIATLPHTTLQAHSALYRSTPVDAGGDDYINAVARIATTLAPLALLHALQALEQAFGRARPYRNAPRTLDLDILLIDQLVSHDPELTLPHPRLAERAFVLLPLLELAPHIAIPGHGPAQALLPAVARQTLVRLPGTENILPPSI